MRKKRHYRPKYIHGYVIPKPRSAYKTQKGWLNAIYKANKDKIIAGPAGGVADPEFAFRADVQKHLDRAKLVEQYVAKYKMEKVKRDEKRAREGKTIIEPTEAQKAREEAQMLKRAQKAADEVAVQRLFSQVTYTTESERLRENALEGMKNVLVIDEKGREVSLREFFRRHNRDENQRFRKFGIDQISWNKEVQAYEMRAADGTLVRWRPAKKMSPKARLLTSDKDFEIYHYDEETQEEFVGDPGSFNQQQKEWWAQQIKKGKK